MGFFNNHMPRTKEAAAEYLCPASLPTVVRQEWISAIMDNADESSLVEKAKLNYVANNCEIYLEYIIKFLDNHGVKCNVEKIDVSTFHDLMKIKDPSNPNNDYQPDNGDTVLHLTMVFPRDRYSRNLFDSIKWKFSGMNVPDLPPALWWNNETRTIRMQILPSITLDNLSLLFRLANFHYTIKPYANKSQGS